MYVFLDGVRCMLFCWFAVYGMVDRLHSEVNKLPESSLDKVS